jgi:hypothetical protein
MACILGLGVLGDGERLGEGDSAVLFPSQPCSGILIDELI